MRVIDGGRDHQAEKESIYDRWDRIRRRGIALIYTNPLRLFWLHDLIEWRINRSYQQAHHKS